MSWYLEIILGVIFIYWPWVQLGKMSWSRHIGFSSFKSDSWAWPKILVCLGLMFLGTVLVVSGANSLLTLF